MLCVFWVQETRVATREESGVLGFPSRRGLTPRGTEQQKDLLANYFPPSLLEFHFWAIYLFIYTTQDIQESAHCSLEMTSTDEDKDISLSLLTPSLASVHIPLWLSLLCDFQISPLHLRSHSLSPGRAWETCQETLW